MKSRKEKIIVGSLILSLFFFLSYEFSLAAGCCIKDIYKNGSDNCTDVASADDCSGVFQNYNICENITAYCKSDSSGATTASASAPKQSTPQEVSFDNPLRYNSVSEVLGALMSNLQSLFVIIAVILVVIGGIMYMFSGANEKMLDKAKSTIGGALIGLAIVLAAPSFLKEIKDILGGGWSSANADQIVSQALTFRQILIKILNFLLSLVGFLGIIGLISGGIMYLLAYGDEDRIKKGKEIISASLIGIIIAFTALVMVRQIGAILGAS